MINGMMMPVKIPMKGGQVSPSVKIENVNTGKFGSMLASLSSHTGMQVDQIVLEEVAMTDELAELLEFTTIEDVMAFLQKNGFDENALPEVIDGYFVFQDDAIGAELLTVLERFVPDLRDQQEWTTDGKLVIPMRELFSSLEEVAEDLLMKSEQGKLLGDRTNEDILLLVSMIQMTAIEGSKTDLTLKQEHQLHTLQDMLKTFGHVLSEEKVQGKKKPVMPFQVTNNQVGTVDAIKQSLVNEQSTATKTTPDSMETSMRGNEAFTKLPNSVISQSSFSIPTAMGMENVKLESEVQGNHRAETLLKELQNIFKRANFGQAGGTSRISIKLYPEHLGQLRIELLQTNGVLTARILASNALGKEMLESQLHQLRQAFLQQNIQVERIDISQLLTETPHQEREQAFNRQFKQHDEQTNDEEHQAEEDDIMNFSEYMIELEG